MKMISSECGCLCGEIACPGGMSSVIMTNSGAPPFRRSTFKVNSAVRLDNAPGGGRWTRRSPSDSCRMSASPRVFGHHDELRCAPIPTVYLQGEQRREIRQRARRGSMDTALFTLKVDRRN